MYSNLGYYMESNPPPPPPPPPEGSSIMDYDLLEFTRFGSSARVAEPITPQLQGIFDTSTPALVTIDGRQYFQVESAAEQKHQLVYDMGSWSSLELVTIAAATAPSPLGGSTAAKMTVTSGTGRHRAFNGYMDISSGARTWCTGIAKIEDGGIYSRVRLEAVITHPTHRPQIDVDLSTGTVIQEVGAVDDFFCVPLTDGYYWFGFRTVSDNTTATLVLLIIDDDGNESFEGDGTSAVRWYNPQVTQTASPVSPFGSAGVITKNKDNGYLAPEDWPTTEMRFGRYQFSIVPYWKTGELEADVYTHYIAGGFFTVYSASDSKFRIYSLSALKLVTDAVTLNRFERVRILIDNVSDTMTILGAASGDGTYSGDSFDWGGNNLSIGLFSTSDPDRFGGLIQEVHSWP